MLRRLGIEESETLPLSFVYETGGPEADGELAAYLATRPGYEVTIEPEGVSGRTSPVELSLEGSFGGWTVTISRA